MILSSYQKCANSLEQSIHEVDLWRVLIISKCKAKLNVTEVVDVVHNEWIGVTFVNWHENDSCFSVRSHHIFDSIQTLRVEMDAIIHMTSNLA